MRQDEARQLIGVIAHATDYDPEARRAYYLRNRKLKGRKKGDTPPPSTGPRLKFSKPKVNKGVVTKNDAHGRQVSIKARVAKLTARLDELRAKLEEIRSKKETPKSNTSSGNSTKKTSDAKPLTAVEKREKAKKAKEKYEEEKDTLPKTEDEIIAEIKRTESAIRAILAEARKEIKRTET